MSYAFMGHRGTPLKHFSVEISLGRPWAHSSPQSANRLHYIQLQAPSPRTAHVFNAFNQSIKMTCHSVCTDDQTKRNTQTVRKI